MFVRKNSTVAQIAGTFRRAPWFALALLLLTTAPQVSSATTIPVTVPNGGFETINKPGTGGTVTGVFYNGGGTNFYFAPDFGTGVSVLWGAGGTPAAVPAVTWSDSTSSNYPTTVDVPGWTRESGSSGNVGIQPAVAHSGLNELGINGSGFGNSGRQITFVSAASLGTIQSGRNYDLQAYAGGLLNGIPANTSIVLQLLANGTPLTPTSSVSPVTSGSYQLYSRDYSMASLAAFVGEQLTIRIGIPGSSSGDQTNFDDVTLTMSTPEPASILMLVVGAAALVGCRTHARIRRRRVSLNVSCGSLPRRLAGG